MVSPGLRVKYLLKVSVALDTRPERLVLDVGVMHGLTPSHLVRDVLVD